MLLCDGVFGVQQGGMQQGIRDARPCYAATCVGEQLPRPRRELTPHLVSRLFIAHRLSSQGLRQGSELAWAASAGWSDSWRSAQHSHDFVEVRTRHENLPASHGIAVSLTRLGRFFVFR